MTSKALAERGASHDIQQRSLRPQEEPMPDLDRETWIDENLRIQRMSAAATVLSRDGLAREWDGLYAHHPESFRRSLARTATGSRRRLETAST